MRREVVTCDCCGRGCPSISLVAMAHHAVVSGRQTIGLAIGQSTGTVDLCQPCEGRINSAIAAEVTHIRGVVVTITEEPTRNY